MLYSGRARNLPSQAYKYAFISDAYKINDFKQTRQSIKRSAADFAKYLLLSVAGLRSRGRILNNTGSRIFCPTPGVQLDHFLHQTPKSRVPVEMEQFILKLLLKEISCCAP